MRKQDIRKSSLNAEHTNTRTLTCTHTHAHIYSQTNTNTDVWIETNRDMDTNRQKVLSNSILFLFNLKVMKFSTILKQFKVKLFEFNSKLYICLRIHYVKTESNQA